MSILDILLGKPLATSDERGEQVGVSAGIPLLGLDAISSAAYGHEAGLPVLIPLGLAGVAYIVPISASIIVLLTIVYFSYRQTIAAYPGGGGSYTVASENLGTFPGLLAAAALMIDYILTAAVGISAGVGALVSAVPNLQPHTLSLCLGILVLITLVNLLGVLILLLPGTASPVRAYAIAAPAAGQPGYQSMWSMLVAAVAGRGWFYYVTIGCVLVILSLSANTAFADFPRLCRAVAQHSFLPHAFGFLGRRLVYTEGILVLAALTAVLLMLFGGLTDRLIPLYAIGAFLAFTLSQAGAVGPLDRRGGGRARPSQVPDRPPGL